MSQSELMWISAQVPMALGHQLSVAAALRGESRSEFVRTACVWHLQRLTPEVLSVQAPFRREDDEKTQTKE